MLKKFNLRRGPNGWMLVEERHELEEPGTFGITATPFKDMDEHQIRCLIHLIQAANSSEKDQG